MSPEQLHGRALDYRTDIFSLGIMLYEMASGERPFRGDSSVALATAILRDTPRPLALRRKDLPEGLIRIISRCLEKSAADRFPSARDLRGALGGVTQKGVGSARSAPSEGAAVARADHGLWVAVLPFKCVGADADLAALANGLADEIATGLSRFRYLSVVSSTSAARLQGEPGSERALGARLGARYVLEGSMRMGGSAIRVSAQLVDTQSGAQIWSETFNRDLQASSFFTVQDDLSARIVATVADSYGVLVHSMQSAMREKDDAALTSAEWQFQYFAYREQITPAAHAALKSRLERALERDDRQSDLWACLAQIYVDEHAFGFGDDETSLDRALAAARRAVELDRANQFALVALAQTHFFRRDLAAFGPAAERAMALNPLNTDAVGILGLQIVHTREFERGAAIVRRAMELNANHAGWMHFAPLWEHFHKGEYEQALACANRVDVPGLFWPFLVMAAASGHLGRRAEAEAAVRDLLALDPEFAAHARSNIESWHFASGLLEPLLEGLRKAGLSIPVTDGLDGAPKRRGTIAEIADRVQSGTNSGQDRADEGFWVAVLPFRYSGASTDLMALAEGLTEEIVTGLSRFSYLRVIARGSTSRLAGDAADVRSIGRELGARYVMEGSIRQAGSSLRVAAQLVDAESGAHLWAETFSRPFEPAQIFEVQDDVAPRIVSTVADMNGVLPHMMSEALRGRRPEELTPYEAVLRSFGYLERLNAEEHAEVRAGLEQALETAPDYADGLAMLSNLHAEEYKHGFNARPDPLGRALEAARRAVAAAPSNHLAYHVLAQALFFRKELAAFRVAAERAVALNPMDGCTTAYMGILLAYAGDWERGVALADRAMELNPRHPGWYRFAAFSNALRKRDYRAALDVALKFNMPTYFYTHAALATAYGHLGETESATNALRELLTQKPDFALIAREELAKWNGPEILAEYMEGLRKAGLSLPPANASSEGSPAGPFRADQTQSPTDSGSTRAEEGFWVAVLPFKYSGSNSGLTALAEGLTEDIVTGLSRFSYLRVIARSSTSRYAHESVDVRTAGKELGARYVMEGNLRQAGSKLRLAVQLVDAVSGAHLWAENYERAFSPEEVFALQDDLVPRIVSTVADQHGVLVHRMADVLRNKRPEELTPYEAVLSVFGFHERMSAEEHAILRDVLERVVRDSPDQGNCWAMLETLYCDEYMFGFNLRPDPLGRALAAAQRAVEAAPTSNLACQALAQALFFRHEFAAFRPLAERTIALNPMDGATVAFMGILIACSGDWDRGCKVAEDAMQLNPHFAGWYRLASLFNAYRQHDYRAAVESSLRINIPGYFWTLVMSAAAYGQLGEIAAAQRALRELLSTRPDFLSTARAELGGWFDDALVEHVIDGLRMAGLEIVPENSGHSLAPESSKSPAPISGAVRTEEGFWVAVLPFKYSGTNSELTALAEGLTEDIVTGLSRFSYLRVIARSSTSRYAHESVDVRTAGKELGARYVMEGNLRQAGSKLRVA
ncbi:MAG TPA: protein kinase, partial [Thermoanaerobaculia bacterium]|nr:protein kinase [Thermoanaerobaculia bacterium]